MRIIAGLFAVLLTAGGAERALGQGDEVEWDGLPSGAGQEEVYYACQACHSLAIVKQQGLSRDSWEETLDWMIEEQGMAELEEEERNLILDYLALNYGRDRKSVSP